MASVVSMEAFKARVMRRVGKIESSKLAPSDTDGTQDELVDQALAEYNRSRSRRMVYEAPGSDTDRRFVLTDIIADWKPGEFKIEKVSRVADANQHNESDYPVPADEWEVTTNTDGAEVLVLKNSIGSGYSMRIRYGQPFVIGANESNTTVPDGDTEPLTMLAVAVVCDWIARTATDLSDSSLGADGVDYSSVASRWSDRAKEARAQAKGFLSPGESASSTGVAYAVLESKSLLGRQPRISH